MCCPIYVKVCAAALFDRSRLKKSPNGSLMKKIYRDSWVLPSFYVLMLYIIHCTILTVSMSVDVFHQHLNPVDLLE